MTPQIEAQEGLNMIKNAIIEYLKKNPYQGNTNIAKSLGLESDFEGNQKNYLSWSILGILVNEGQVKYTDDNTRKKYYISNIH